MVRRDDETKHAHVGGGDEVPPRKIDVQELMIEYM
jgi:hypothetical protein